MKAAFALAGFVLLCVSSAHATTVAFGSYLNEIFAVDSARRTSAALGVSTRLVPAVVDGARYLRVLGPSGMSEREARDLLRRAQAHGISGAWLVAESGARSPTGAPAGSPTGLPTGAPAGLPTGLLTGSPTGAPASSPMVPAAVLPAVIAQADETPVEAGATVAGSAPERLLLTASGLDSGMNIDVPGFAEDDFEFVLDGELNEPIWSQVPGYDGMRVLDPDTLEVPRHKTIIRYFYTPKALYVSMYAEQPSDTLIERLSSRDDYFLRDGMSITLDTSGTGLYGYWFSVNLGGALADGKILPERQYSKQWDGAWDGATARHDDGWTMEMVLPWSMMAMPSTEGARAIGVFVSRLVGYIDERYGFPALPSTGARFMSALQPLKFEQVRPRRQLDLYPYVSGTYDAAAEDGEGKAGVDLFWRPSTNLQVSATLNPDFGAVESDDVVVNLTATEAFFPEKRLFFLEGNEIFATTPRSVPRQIGGRTAGSRRTTQLFNREPTQVVNTRRIGGALDTDIPPGVVIPGYELSKPTDLLGAIRGTGQISAMRYGFLAAFEDDFELTGTENGEEVTVEGDGREFGVVRLLYQNTGAGRQSVGYIGTHVKKEIYDATVHGVDGHYLSASGKLQLDAQLLASDVDNVDGSGVMVDMNYTQRQGVVHTVTLDAVDDTLDINDLGFLRRNDNYGGVYTFNYTRSQGLNTLRTYKLNVLTSYWENGDGLATRVGTFFRNTFTFRNLFELRTEIDYFPQRWEDLESRGNGAYRVDGGRWVFDVAFGTDASKAFSFSGRLGTRREELDGWAYNSSLGVTFKPNDRFSLDLDLNYTYREGWLLYQQDRDFTSFTAKDFQPRLAVDYFLSARQQLRLTMQWAAIKAEDEIYYERTEDGDGYLVPVIRDPSEPGDDFVINRMTMQFRYRWQIAPLSDLFVVYTRGSNVSSMIDESIDDLFRDALNNPVIDLFVVKLRYRFGA
ncbi:MAG: DUF5916 domain-containing protein [Gammaproteobacteria bacterium]|nr:DUF5916 domain-containing protein [Gammaproteobacteria bacterium]